MIAARFRARIVAVLGLAWLAIGSAPASAQFERYELGRRLRDFEVEWDRVPDPSARAKACQSLKAAVNSYFGLRLDDAGPTEGERWAGSLCLKPDGRLIDATTLTLEVTLAAFYPIGAKMPEGARIRLSLGDSPGSRVEVPIGPLPMTLTLPIVGLEAGDHDLVAEVRSGELALMRASETISLADRLDDRLLALSKTVAGWPEDPESATADRESVRGQLRMLESLAAKIPLEADFPANRILVGLEEQAQAADRSEAYLGKDRPGQAWVTVVTGTGRRVATRLFVPEAAAKGDPLPIVVALHGAGGTENMFFETYGHGAIVERCRERGWLLVAPRSTAFAGAPVSEVVDALAKIYPVDLARVMLVGHSMGAGQAVGAALREPARYAAVAALGGGGSFRTGAGLKALPFFVGIGSEDFALKGAKDLADDLNQAGVSTVIYREYPSIEHLAIVQVALPDIFRFFDERAKPR
jgi:pimeloyl-ACP methyl ester carboxylesterase